MHIMSPTLLGIRDTDDFGSGHFRAPRGDRIHGGVDYVCVPKQDIVAPIGGLIERIAYPYVDDLRWSGCVILNRDICIKMFYFRPTKSLIGTIVTQGQTIGVAQDISKKYNTETKTMTPHIHLQIEYINPESIRK